MIYLIIPQKYSSRFVEYFKKNQVDAKEVEECFLELDTNDYALVNNLISKDFVSRYISRMFFVDKKITNIDELQKINKKIRIQVYPKIQENKVLEKLEERGFDLSPTEFEEVLSVVYVNDQCYYGLLNKKHYFRKIHEKKIARAYYKIKQLVFEKQIKLDNKVVLDVGAAPGGWSEYLKDHVEKIVAVDPAQLKIEGDNIVYFKNKIEDVISEVNNYNYDIIICDVNDVFYSVFNNILKLNYKNKQLIMTLKFSKKSLKKINQDVEEIKEFLKMYAKDVEILFLFANTKFERTLFCVLN